MLSISPTSMASLSNNQLKNSEANDDSFYCPTPSRPMERQVNGQHLNFRGENEFTSHQTPVENSSQTVLRSYLSNVTASASSSVLAERFPIANDGLRTPVNDIIHDFESHKNRFEAVTDQISQLSTFACQASQEVNTLFLLVNHSEFKAHGEANEIFSALTVEGPVKNIADFLGTV